MTNGPDLHDPGGELDERLDDFMGALQELSNCGEAAAAQAAGARLIAMIVVAAAALH